MVQTKWMALALGTVVALAAAACGDDVEVNDDSPKTDAGGGGDDDTADGGGTGDCTTKADQAAANVCTLSQAKADTALTIQLREQCGSECNGAVGLPVCNVTVAGTDITLSLDQKVCSPQTDQACATICRINAFDCKLPALAKGSYQVHFNVNNEKVQTSLFVSESGTQTSCALPAPPNSVPPISTDPFNTIDCNTVDSPCVPVVAGDPCSPCSCPSGSVLGSQKTAYETAYFAAKSQCPDNGGPKPSCAPCQERVAQCNVGTGKCELKTTL